MPKWTEEQTQAIYKKGKNIIVSAGAGSGKTAVLSQRVLEHVKSGINIDELLILTFTNAAAQEMKERICRGKGIQGIPDVGADKHRSKGSPGRSGGETAEASGRATGR